MNTILVLNSGKDALGALNPETTDRIEAGMDYALSQKAGEIIMVGGDASSMVDFAASHYPELPIPLSENMSKDTLEGAHFVKLEFLVPNDWREVDVFTSDFHVPRTDWIFRRVLGERFRVRTHPVPGRDIDPAKADFVRKREQVQLAVAKFKLAGIGPVDDGKRAERLSRLRFRGKQGSLARLLMKTDELSNVRRY